MDRYKDGTFKPGIVHPNWVGDKATYGSIHQWVSRNKTKTGICSHCNRKRYTENANISGNCLRDVEDYIELCCPCHRKFDKKYRGRR